MGGLYFMDALEAIASEGIHPDALLVQSVIFIRIKSFMIPDMLKSKI
jgi:hypothetical protein